MEVSGNAALFRDGDYKLVTRIHRFPTVMESWRLYYLKEDPGETRDLSEMLPGPIRSDAG